jgi:DNA-directed RNA polymerase specialized sigma24 family protein
VPDWLQTGARLPGLSAEDVVATVRVHLDRVHDAVRRLGCDAAAALEVVETSAIDLVTAVAESPETVPDPVGWWFARARSLGTRVGADTGDLPVGFGLLSADEDQLVLADALEQLPERDRAALLLRDSYSLPPASVGAALGTDAAGAMDLVARARLAFLPFADDEPAPPVPSHQGQLGALGRVADGGPLAPPDAAPRRHAMVCPQCRSVVDAQQRAHLLLAGLTVVALPEAERVALLGRVDEHAAALLPSAASLRVAADDEQEWDEEDRLLSPLLALVGLILATALGVALGVALTGLGDDGLDPREAAANMLPPVAPAPVLSPAPLPAPPPTSDPRPKTRVFVIPDPTTPPPSPPPSPSSPAATAAPTLAVSPGSGPGNARLTVTGAGWQPGVEVALDYLDPQGTPTPSGTTATPDADGAFSVQLVARDPSGAPGRHTVRASDGTHTQSAPYDVTR